MTTWKEHSVGTLERRWNELHTQCHRLEGQVRDSLRDLKKFCTDAGDTQKANDEALQDLHRELGQLAGAANQQELTTLLIQPSETTKPSVGIARKGRVGSRSRAVAHPKPAGADLRSTIERARERANRFNVARIAAWLTELEQAIRLGNYALIERGLKGLAAELTK